MPAYSSEQSFYKIGIMTAPNEENWYWYNFISENTYSYNKIINGMVGRLKTHLASGKHPCKVQALCVYDNRTNAYIEKLPLSVLM